MSTRQIIKRPQLSQNDQVIRQLTRLRWKFYIQTTADAVQRHKHIVLLVSLLMGPMLFAVLLALSKPVLSLVNPESVIETIKIWSIFLFLHVSWSLFQRKALNGGEGYQYLMLHPIPNTIKTRIEFRFLATLSLVIQLPFIVALIYLWSASNLFTIILNSLCIILWGIGLLLIQMLIVQKNKYVFAFCVASFIAPLSLAFFKITILTIVLSILFILTAYRQWIIGKTSQPIRIKLPSLLRVQARYSPPFINLVILTFRKLFDHSVLAQRILFFIVAWSASGVLAWFALQKNTWVFIYIDVSPQTLMNLICAVYISTILTQIGMMKTSLVNTYSSTQRFWFSLGISNKQWLMSEIVVLSGVALIASLATLVWVVISNGIIKGLSLSLFVLLAIPIIRAIYNKPEDVHGIVPLILFVVWFAISALLLNF